MFDLHSHILPGLDDGAADYACAMEMALAFLADGVDVVACTPHILPGLYHNAGPQIRLAVTDLQLRLDEAAIPLRLVAGADNHITPDFVRGLKSGRLLTLNDTRYVLVEPPHHVAPARLEDLFFEILMAGYVPILTHPERLTWIGDQYPLMQRLVESGVWMQVTSGSLTGTFGRDSRYWAERLLDEGLVHILATDAHDTHRRPPDLARGRELAAKRLGDGEATNLVFTRPRGILVNAAPSEMPLPARGQDGERQTDTEWAAQRRSKRVREFASGTLSGRLRSFFE